MLSAIKPYHKPLGDGLVMKSIATREDVERLAEFNVAIHGAGVDAMTRELILNHPHTLPKHWVYIEEESTGRILSSLCLLPWRWNYAGVKLLAGEMGICGTLEEYRNRGLVRLLMARHKELLAEGGFHLSSIQGIPYFYRQFEYEYAIPLESGWQIELQQIPDLPADSFTYREATVEDIPVMMRLYESTERQLDISALRDANEWRFMIEESSENAMKMDIFVLVDSGNQAVGYWSIQRGGFGDGLNVNEASQMPPETALVALGFLKQIAIERAKPSIRLIGHESSSVIQAALDIGAKAGWQYAWQLHIPDPVQLLRVIAPVLQERIANSAFAGLSRTVVINAYKAFFGMNFGDGNFRSAISFESGEAADLSCPPLLFAQLVFGWKSREELAAIYPDFSTSAESAALIDVLFPKMNSFLYPVY